MLDIGFQIKRIGQKFGVYVRAYGESDNGVYIAEFKAYTKGKFRGTGAMNHIIKLCRRLKYDWISLIAYPTEREPCNGYTFTEGDVKRLVKWYQRFGYKLVGDFKDDSGNDMKLTLKDDK